MPGLQLPDSDSEDEMPPAWEERATNDGYVFYVNHQTKSTQWTHPRTGKSKHVAGELPIGWEREIEESTGRVIFVDRANAQRTYTDPRLAFAVEELPRNIGEVRQRFDASSTALQVLHGKDLSGRVAIVTGANVGIGFETAKSLAMHGCQVVLACRKNDEAAKAIAQISEVKAAAGKLCRFMFVDLADMWSVRRFVDEVKEHFNHIDMLILNAAVFALPHSTTIDQLETTFQVCHLAHFYLTTRLDPLLDHRSRVIVVSSESHRMANLPTDGLTESLLSPPASKYWAMIQYNNVKLCNVLFARELGRRWEAKGVATYSLHPGNMVSSSLSRNWWFYRVLFAFVRPFTKSLQQAASTTVFCATAPELTGMTGHYFNNCFFCESSKAAQNDELARTLWTLSEEMIGRIFDGEPVS